ncbi:hypothetical protein CPB83DRAFT_861869 [Crepidotus variabilis]|uniref:Uncharacterized protein n=1 Tax=Crepidotus variabilis TaxID=179855 RepID=A0A9P6JKV0_9AGAR|nr:hypothetical protein CPB83DRAFT_861869 [Crepidotus variabilis]
MKVQFLEGLKKAESGLEEAKKPHGKVFQRENKSTPWQRAKAVMERSRAEGKVSSALVISYAYKEFMAGVETMRLLKTETAPDGRKRWVGKPAAIVELTNGLIRDLRAFHLDHKDWFSQYNSQGQLP